MVDRYWRKIESVENDIENAIQISSILLKLKGYDEKLSDLSKIGHNENNISSNSGQISTNEGNISSNSGRIATNEGNVSSNSGRISTNEGNILSNLSKINNIENDMKINNDIYNKTFIIPNMFTTWRSKLIFDITINSKFTTNGIIKINAINNYSYDKNYNFTHVYNFYNDSKNFKKVSLKHNVISNIVNDKFDIQGINSTEIKISTYLVNNGDNKKIELFDHNTIQVIYNETTLKSDINKNDISSNSGRITTNEGNISSNSGQISTNEGNISSNSGRISTNEEDISSNSGRVTTNEGNISFNSGRISTNEGNISSNLEKINDNKDDILSLQNSNIKAFYNLDKIFIYDIEKGNQNVNKDNHFHIFEKEITHNFIKDSYLEIILKVLTEVSSYVLIGFFQISCNFYDENDDLFYTISLSTAMGSINKLSTIKSVFIVPINKSMNKIKIYFFTMPKIGQENRSARFIIQDINSNKIYIKYYQKTDEMSIKNIQDSLNNVNSISARVDKLEKSMYLKNLLNILYHENDIQIRHIFFEKTYTINTKKNYFLEIYFKMLLKYDNFSNSKYVITNFILYDDSDNQLYSASYDNSDYIANSNIDILSNNTFYYNFDSDTTNLKIVISFSISRSRLDITNSSINTNRLIIKHYGN